jgi:hypothetical protein
MAAKGAAMTTQHSSTAGGAGSHGSVVRAAFHRDLERLELDLQAMGSLAPRCSGPCAP